MTWHRVEALLRALFSVMPEAPYVIGAVTVAGVTLAVVATQRGWWHGRRGWLWAALCATVGAIIIATLAFRIGDLPPEGSTHEVVLSAFQGMLHAAGPHASLDEWANFYGNIALFVPLGVLLAWLLRGRLATRVLYAWTLGAALSTSIELTQSTMARVSDVNDMILNSAGALLGAAVGVVVLTTLKRTTSVQVGSQSNPALPEP